MKIHGAVLEYTGRQDSFEAASPITVAELELAPPTATELLIRIDAAGVCHSDLSVVNGSRPRPVPMLLGHEASGTVIEVGDDVDDVAVGDRVVTTFLPRCGRCTACLTEGRLPCTVGSASNAEGVMADGGTRLRRNGTPIAHHLGVSAFATHAVVDRRSVVPVDRDVPPDLAAVLGCAVLTGGGAVLNVRPPEAGETIAVVGLGGVGVAALMVARAQPGCRVVGIDMLPDKLALARDLGADDVLTPDQARDQGLTVDIVIEAAGHPRAFETAVAIAAMGATVVTVGLPDPEARASISPLEITSKALSIVGSYLGSAVPSRDIPRYVELWRTGRLPLERLISSRIALHEINTAMDRLASGNEIRQIITFGESVV